MLETSQDQGQGGTGFDHIPNVRATWGIPGYNGIQLKSGTKSIWDLTLPMKDKYRHLVMSLEALGKTGLTLNILDT